MNERLVTQLEDENCLGMSKRQPPRLFWILAMLVFTEFILFCRLYWAHPEGLFRQQALIPSEKAKVPAGILPHH